ncbi:MAG TPA: DUF1801 domain-containing protein [Flavobacteriales bacterium]|nr:DUF1801 domain-containing protein [Flavobacteriales bacterium]
MARPKINDQKQGKSLLADGMRFTTVAALLEFLPAKERALTEQLRELIISEAPDLKERLSFNVPFYKGLRDVCFLWPASVLWGKTKTYEGVRFGLSYGSLVPGCEPYLQRGERKQVCWRDLQELTNDDERRIRVVLGAAVVEDQERAGGLR